MEIIISCDVIVDHGRFLMAENDFKQNELKEQKREAQRILNRVERESEQVGTSSMARTANKVRNHFLDDKNAANDRIEVIGRRIGRGLAIIAVIGLAAFLFIKYIIPQ